MTATHSALFAFSCLLVSVVARTSSAQTIYWTDLGTSKIQRVDLSEGVVEDLVTSPQVFSPVDIALDLAGGKMYWTDSALGDLNIVRADLDGSNVQPLIFHVNTPSGIALDVPGGKMYWTDIAAGKIQRANLDGSGLEDLVIQPAVQSPVDIALDLVGNKFYWTESTPADFMILRADLDGNNVEFLVTGLISPSGIALDVPGGKIYWTDLGSDKIQRANLNGSGVEDLVTTSIFEPVGIALDLPAGKMYWTDASPGDFYLHRANLDGSNRELFVTGLLSPSGIALALQPEGVPTLSEWGLVWMTLTLVALGAVLLISPRDLRANSMD